MILEQLSYKISTITMSIRIPDCSLNLINIGKYMKIDEDIIGIKYNFSTPDSSILKGKYSTSIYNKSKVKNRNKINSKLFYNQVSIIIKLSENNIINVKLFNNGSLHLTGVKNIEDGKLIVNLLYRKLLDIINIDDLILLTLDSNNVYLDNNNNVYSNSKLKKSIIGFKHENVYNIHRKEYIIENNTFISCKFESKRTKTILNFDGIKIGYSEIELLKNKSKLYKKNSNIHIDKESNLIYYDGMINSQIVGKINYYTNDKITNKENQERIIEYNYSCNPFISKVLSLDELNKSDLIVSVNCINIYFGLNFLLNRQRLFNKLHEMKYTCEYKPEKYSGVKLRYKTNSNKTGVCNCFNECICINTTFLIFQSGNIIAMGFKNIKEIQFVLDEFNILINSIKYIIKKKTL